MSANRRTFLTGAAGATLVTQLGGEARAAASVRASGDLTSRMSWFNEPASVSYPEGGLIARSKPKTDFWRKTFYGYITDNGHFFHLPVSGEFTFEARVIGKYASLYDQAGLMVRLDEKHWMKCGSEFFEQRRWASVGLKTSLLAMRSRQLSVALGGSNGFSALQSIAIVRRAFG